MNLVGQVVKTFPSLQREPKVRAARAVVSLALRTLSDYAQMLRNTRDDIRAVMIEYLLTTRDIPNRQRAIESADGAILHMALAVGHGLIRRATLALSASHILPTLDILAKEPLGTGFDMIDRAVRLEHARDR